MLGSVRQMSRYDANCRAISPQSLTILSVEDNGKDNAKDGSESKTMDATRATEQSQDSKRQYPNLDDRYGKIGISAVAAAVRYQRVQRKSSETRFIPNDCD
jgi:hypothetical protein